MSKSTFTPTRRAFIGGALGAAAIATAPVYIRRAKAAEEFKIGLFIALSGPASLFGPTQRAAAELAVDQVNAAGGILGKEIKLIVVDGGAAPADAAKTGVRLMLNEKVDFFVGSHDSAVREALVSTFKGRTPYVYTPIYEGGECAPNTYVIADTPQQQMDTALPWLAEKFGSRRCYMIGDDYVWPRTTNAYARKVIEGYGGVVVEEEYVPFGAPNKFEEIVTRIKAKAPGLVLITLVGADNVNFNRTFAGFGLDKDIVRMSSLLEENTLLGIGAESSKNLFGAMSYYANIESETNNAFKAAYAAKHGANAPILSLIGEDAYSGIKFAEAVTNKAGSTDADAVNAASVGLSFNTPGGVWTMRENRHVDKDMHLADATGGVFKVVQSFSKVASGQTCA